MLFYGNRCRQADPRQIWDELSERLAMALAMPPGLSRHAALTTSLIEWGALLQGVADAGSEAGGFDQEGPAETALAARLGAIADELCCSFDSLCWRGSGIVPALIPPALPQRVVLRAPEGFLHYGVYPETYRAAAMSLATPPAMVIGIRSIGTSLAALVAAASGAPATMTVRPRGEPYRRRIVADPALPRRLSQTAGAIAVVDEGPGLSGSSFMAVTDWLEQAGVARRRIHLFPSHEGPPGPEASGDTIERWPGFARHVVPFDDLFLSKGKPAHRLTTWLEDAIGPLDGPLEDLSAGQWRAITHRPEQIWPPAIPAMERRKYRGLAGGRPVLVKFAGLGLIGERKLDQARALATAGFTPEPLALLHGFLVERWLPAAPHRGLEHLPRKVLIARLADYLAFRAVTFPADAEEGASLAELVEMAVYNTDRQLGPALSDRLAPKLEALPRQGPALRRCATDNRLQPFEWLVGPDGRLIKTDALDHAFGHDLIGCQDIAWDLAGSGVEFDLEPAEREALAHGVERRAGRAISRDLVRLLEPCYLACELARLHFGLAMTGGLGDRHRLVAAQSRYGQKLRQWIASSE
jgi:hypothetical protein